MVSHSKHKTIDAVEQKNKDKKKIFREHARVKIVDRINHQIII